MALCSFARSAESMAIGQLRQIFLRSYSEANLAAFRPSPRRREKGPFRPPEYRQPTSGLRVRTLSPTSQKAGTESTKSRESLAGTASCNIPVPARTLSDQNEHGHKRIQPHQRPAKASAFNRPICPFGPTTNGSDNAFQFPSSSAFQVRPSSRLISDPFVPAVIQTFNDSDH